MNTNVIIVDSEIYTLYTCKIHGSDLNYQQNCTTVRFVTLKSLWSCKATPLKFASQLRKIMKKKKQNSYSTKSKHLIYPFLKGIYMYSI